MSVESELYGLNQFVDLLGAVTALQVADMDDEQKVELLRQWVARMGEEYEEWMTRVVTGPPVGGDEPGEVEVIVG